MRRYVSVKPATNAETIVHISVGPDLKELPSRQYSSWIITVIFYICSIIVPVSRNDSILFYNLMYIFMYIFSQKFSYLIILSLPKARKFGWEVTTRFFISNAFFGPGSNVAYQNSNFPKIGLTLPDKMVFKILFGKRAII